MGLILRTSSLANAGDTISIKGTPLEYSEGDGNFMYLLSHMSGSVVTITGDTALTGSLNISTILNASTDTDRFLVSDAGIIKYRSGSQILGDIAANLQSVTDIGATTTNIITVGGVTGSLFGTSSWASKAISSSYAQTSSYALSASYALQATSASYALSASEANTLGGITSSGYVKNTNDIYASSARITDVITLSQTEWNSISASALSNTLYLIV
jgi:hypothetical protein